MRKLKNTTGLYSPGRGKMLNIKKLKDAPRDLPVERFIGVEKTTALIEKAKNKIGYGGAKLENAGTEHVGAVRKGF